MVTLMFDFEADKADLRFAPPGSHPEPEVNSEAPAEIIAAPAPVSPPVTLPAAKPVPVIPMPPAPPAIQRPAPPQERIKPRAMPFDGRRRDWLWIVFAAALFVVVLGLGLVVTLVIDASRANDTAPQATQAAVLPTPVDARTHDDSSQLRPAARSREAGMSRWKRARTSSWTTAAVSCCSPGTAPHG